MVLFFVVPTIGWLIGVAGIVMVLIAIGKISQVVSDKSIYANMKNALVLGAGATAVVAVGAIVTLYSFVRAGLLTRPSFGPGFQFHPSPTFGSFPPLQLFTEPVLAVIGIVVVAWAMLVVSAVFVRRSYRTTSSKLNISMFDTAGLLFLVGVATAIIGIGIVLIFVAEILLSISFFSLPEGLAAQPSQTTIVATG